MIQVHPIIYKNHIIDDYPKYVIKGKRTTSNPKKIVQKAAYLKEVHGTCIYPLIFGNEPSRNSSFTNRTTQLLITENALLIQNARNNTLQSNCKSDDRKLVGNFLILFSNCSITINNQTIQNNEIIQEPDIIHGTFHNIRTNWNYRQNLNISKINNENTGNREKLEHVFLEQRHLRLKFWTLFGGLSFTYTIRRLHDHHKFLQALTSRIETLFS